MIKINRVENSEQLKEVESLTSCWEESREVKVSIAQFNAGYELYLAYDNEDLIAVSTLCRVEQAGLHYISTISEIKEFYQVCSFSGLHRGGGRALMEFYIKRAKENNLPLYINSVSEAVNFYSKFSPDFYQNKQFIFNYTY